jgi:hypothetical protein
MCILSTYFFQNRQNIIMMLITLYIIKEKISVYFCIFPNKQFPFQVIKGKAVPLHAMEALGGRGGIAPTHS